MSPLAYELPTWKGHRALINAKLEPHLGFLHSLQYSKPSLVLDFMEIYRYLIEYLIVGFCRDLDTKNFVFKEEKHGTKQGKRQYLNKQLERAYTEKLEALFQSSVKIPRVNIGQRQELESLICEEALPLAKYLRNERKEWVPRIARFY